MRAVAQRVNHASVLVDGETVGEIRKGLLVYLGIAKGDDRADVQYMVNKLCGLRVFVDEQEKMSKSVLDVKGEVLVVSQFTLFGDVRSGRRPSFGGAAAPEVAESLCEQVIDGLQSLGIKTSTGRFRAMMDVRCSVDGPITILVDSRKHF